MIMKLIAFWKYDIFPYCLWGELVKADKDRFWIKGYEGFCFVNSARIAFLPEVQAKQVIAELEILKQDHATAVKSFDLKAKNLINGLK